MNKSIIHKIYYRDDPEFDHMIEVLFETSQGWFWYNDFQLERIEDPVLPGWTLFSAFNEQFASDEERFAESVRLDRDMALIVLLATGDYIVVYFNGAVLIGINSAQVLEIFSKNSVSETFKQLFDTAQHINV